MRSLDQPHGVVAAPAEAVLDLDRGERRLAGVAPVDGSRAAVHQPGLEQRQEQPLRPAVHDGVGAEERALPVEGEAEPLQLPGHVRRRSARPTRSAGCRRSIAPSSAGRPKASKPKLNRTLIAARAAEAGVGVADRVAAHVPDVHVARGERRRGLDVQVRLLVLEGGRPGGVALAPGGLPAGLDRVRVIGSCEPMFVPSLMSDEDTQGDRTQGPVAMLEIRWPTSATTPFRRLADPLTTPPRAGSSRPEPTARINRWR